MPVFPPTGGGPGFTGYNVQFVHPDGNNHAPGTLNAPKKTGSMAYTVLADGGQVFLAPGSKWSDGTEGLGLTDGQGCWIGNGGNIPGFLAQKSVEFCGWGYTSAGQFGTLAAAMSWGKLDGSTTRDDPGIWLSGVAAPITFRNLFIQADQPVRLGIDYRRNADATYKDVPVTNATRLNGLTTLTVTLPTSAIRSFQRNNGRVTVSYVLDEFFAVIREFCYVRIDAGDLTADFPSGDYLVQDSGFISGSTYTFAYDQGSGDKAEEFPVGATFGTTGVVGADNTTSLYTVVEITSNSSEFPSTMYLTGGGSSDPTKIVLRDPYGGSHGRTTNVSVNDIGTFRLQLRYAGCTFETIEDCIFYSTQVGGEKFGIGPTVDRGDSSGGGEWNWMRRCFMLGAVTGGPLAEQEIARTSNIFAHGAAIAAGMGGYDLQMSEGGIYFPRVTGTFATFQTVLQDTAIGTPIFPTVTMENGTGYVRMVDIAIADAEQSVPVDLGSVGGAVTLINSAASGKGINSVYLPPPVVLGGNNGSTVFWSQQTDSFDHKLWNGFWGNDGRVAGKTDLAVSQFGVVQHPGFSNLCDTDLTHWTTSGAVTVTADQSTAGLDDSGKAYKLSCSSGTGAVYIDITTPSAAAGDSVILGYWVKAATDHLPADLLAEVNYRPTFFPFPVIGLYCPFANDGAWDWLVDIATIDSSMAGQTTLRLILYVEQNHDIIVYQPHILRLAASDSYSANEVYRLLRTFRPIPPYLASGDAGTMEGIRLVGAGGLKAGSNTTPIDAAAAPGPFLYIPTVDDDPTTTPADVDTGHVAMCFNPSTRKLWVYLPGEPGWFHSDAFSNA